MTIQSEQLQAAVLHDLRPTDDSREVVDSLVKATVRVRDGAAEILDPEGLPRFRPDGFPMTAADLITELRGAHPTWFATPARPASTEHTTVEAETKPTFSGSNPWAAGSINITQQWALERDNPQEAARLKVEASKAAGLGDPRNPFSKAGFNLTEAMKLEISDPARAAQLKAEAGR